MSNIIPKNISLYREESYWDERYATFEGGEGESEGEIKERDYDWLLKYSNNDALKPSLKPLIRDELEKRKGGKVLVLGCGNSTLSYDLLMDGYGPIVSIDYSSTIIELLKKRHHGIDGLQFIKMDIKDMSHFEDGTFSTIIDKGTLDAIFTDNSSVWDPSPLVRGDISCCLREIQRLMGKDSIFISISFGQPHFRLPLLSSPLWDLKAKEIDGTFCHLYEGKLL